MHNRLYNVLRETNILFEKQVGFQNSHSTVHAIIQLQSNLSIADMLYSGHLVIADIFSRNGPNNGQTLIEIPLYSGQFYSGHLLWRTYFLGTA